MFGMINLGEILETIIVLVNTTPGLKEALETSENFEEFEGKVKNILI